MDRTQTSLELGLDIGSTTVKGVVLDRDNTILWKKYLRHNGHQAHCLQELVREVAQLFPDRPFYRAVTGSGARSVAGCISADFIQEVNAVTLAVETFYPETGSVVELGGQDAKVIIWRGSGRRRSTLSFMNDKCAGGTGSTIDKILRKVGLSHAEIDDMAGMDITPHKISAKCGVFAETDVVGLLKAGVDKQEIFYSLCNAIVNQNLEVLVRGNILRDRVLLLGGPNRFIRVLQDVWRKNIKKTWELQGYTPTVNDLERAITVPGDAEYFAALGAVLFNRGRIGVNEPTPLDSRAVQRKAADLEQAGPAGGLKGLVDSQEEADAFCREYTLKETLFPEDSHNDPVSVVIGMDGGSTSTKMVLLETESGTPCYRDYLLSSGNPIDDVRLLLQRLDSWMQENSRSVNILGAGVTGYAAEIIHRAFSFDSSVVETVAHMKSANREFGDIDVICDVGGQDIKVLFMKHGRVVDFKLNTQCSAGNGYFLQGMAEQFDIPVEQYADYAFAARRAPEFNYGCAVFLEQDKVNFQQAGWSKEEMMAGLAHVLPLNIWNHVVQEPNLAKFGRRFVLQGGTQKNKAALKAQVDYITSAVPGSEVFLHPYADIGGAIGAALEVLENRQQQESHRSSFIGLQAAQNVTYTSTNDYSTICKLCANRCRRTFIDIDAGGRQVRFISGNLCERGGMEYSSDASRKRSQAANLVDRAARTVFAEYPLPSPPPANKPVDRSSFYEWDALHRLKDHHAPFRFSDNSRRKNLVVGIPRLLNMYYYTPFFSTYLRSLGVGRVVYSGYTTDRLWHAGNKLGAIDPCFPAKAAPAHIYNLLQRERLDAILFPILTHLESPLEGVLGNTACAIQMGTPEVVEAVFTRERDYFREKNVAYWDPVINMDRPVEIEGALYEYFHETLGITEDENAWAVKAGEQAQQAYLQDLRDGFAAAMNTLIDEDRVGLLVIGHPYHNDPGINHGIPDEFQKRGYPVFTIESLPTDREFLDPLFADGKEGSTVRSIWERSFNRNTNHKVWAAMVAARHPNLAVIDLSSFKCGHDAPTYSYIDELLDVSGTPHFTFHDIDQNRPGASFKIRIDTIDYFLKRYERWLKKEVSRL
ncbi:MAG: BadF/BadG/BcrA/BcrD ATPase family protein [Fibrobacterota bacterium]